MNLPVTLPQGGTMLLGAVAQVTKGVAPRYYAVESNGGPAVAFFVRKEPKASTIRVAHAVDAIVPDLLKLLPPGSAIHKVYDQSEIIAESRSEVIHDLRLGVILCVVVLFLLLGSVRTTLVVASTIPLTLFVSLACMHLLGLGLNVITMSALSLGIGMFIDDAVIVAENIFRMIHPDRRMEEVVWDGVSDIAAADASGTFTTVASFLPLLLVTGLPGLFVKPFGLTVSIGLLASLALSLTVIPALFIMVIPATTKPWRYATRQLAWLVSGQKRALRFALRHRVLTLLAAVLVLCAGGLGVYRENVSLLPPIDEGAVLIEYTMPPGTALTENETIGATVNQIALDNPDVQTVYWRAGSPAYGYQIEGVNRAEMLIKLKPTNERTHTAMEVMDALRATYSTLPGMVFLYHQPTQEKFDESLSGLPALLGVTIYGPHINELVQLADKVEPLVSKDPAVSGVINNTKVKASEIVVRPDYRALAQHRARLTDVFATLESARFGTQALEIVKQHEKVAVLVKTQLSGPYDTDSLANLPVSVDDGKAMVPLDQLAHIEFRQTMPSVTRMNGEREITLITEADGNVNAAAKRIQDALRTVKLPAGYRIEITGQYRQLTESIREMGFVVLFAIILIFLIMAMHFRSWLMPFLILLVVPFSLAGASVALWLFKQDASISVAMGCVTLVGIAVNNGIVLADFANRRVKRRRNVLRALYAATTIRLRPVLMTTAVTIAALIPAAIGGAVGSHLFQSFAIALIGGLIANTVATLVVLPILLDCYFMRCSRRVLGQTAGNGPK